MLILNWFHLLLMTQLMLLSFTHQSCSVFLPTQQEIHVTLSLHLIDHEKYTLLINIIITEVHCTLYKLKILHNNYDITNINHYNTKIYPVLLQFLTWVKNSATLSTKLLHSWVWTWNPFSWHNYGVNMSTLDSLFYSLVT